MISAKPDFFSRIYNPFYQSVFVIVLVVLAMVVLKLLNSTHVTDIHTSVYWVVGGAGLLFFGIFNSVISLKEGDMNVYWYQSFGAYAALLLLTCIAALFLSGVSIDEAGSFKWIFSILTFAYLLFLSLMRAMRKVVSLAQKEDDSWQSRQKK